MGTLPIVLGKKNAEGRELGKPKNPTKRQTNERAMAGKKCLCLQWSTIPGKFWEEIA